MSGRIPRATQPVRECEIATFARGRQSGNFVLSHGFRGNGNTLVGFYRRQDALQRGCPFSLQIPLLLRGGMGPMVGPGRACVCTAAIN